MTLLTICTAVCSEVSLTAPSTIVGNTAPDAVRLLRYANRVGNRLMKKVQWQVLRKEQTFTGVAGAEQTAILPSNFDRFVGETFRNRTSGDLISGPISAVEWQGFLATSYSGPPRFIYRGGSVFITPDLAGGEALAFEYISSKWCQSSGGTAQVAWAADTDTGIIDEELMTLDIALSYLAGEGLPLGDLLEARNERLGLLADQDQAKVGVLSAGDIFGGRHFDGAPVGSGTDY